MYDSILIIDFGSQFTQLIARNIRDLNVFCEIVPFNKPFIIPKFIKAIILSGSPASVKDDIVQGFCLKDIPKHIPILGICFGAQWLVHNHGGLVSKSAKREYGRVYLNILTDHPLLTDIPKESEVWMSHSDTIQSLPPSLQILARTESISIAAFAGSIHSHDTVIGLQFHPEVFHSEYGKQILKNFVFHIAHLAGDFTMASERDSFINGVRNSVTGDQEVLMALSGGVDSTVTATIIQKAIGNRLHCFFIDNGLLRKHEFENVIELYKRLNLNVQGIDKKQVFYDKLKGVFDPETKRKIIGNLFIEVFNEQAKQYPRVSFLGQGTIYPDVIESNNINGLAHTIKSHHNVGGLPKDMALKLVEPLRLLFKDEVRKLGHELGIPDEFLYRHPFPGPGLAIRIIGDITPDKIAMLQDADAIFIDLLKKHHLYASVWQAGVMLLPHQTVGVMGDERTYEKTVALRAVTSRDGMTADWAELPYWFLKEVSNTIINQVKGINRVVYDISSKPPATIEWE
ncbi:MAG: glutamine-hydrolyzing GMP synthase [Alphaproteobacteria bacterium]|nr:glutamine-hydrolyzing GMP synthase [Alphaproteobacteria bacterium]